MIGKTSRKDAKTQRSKMHEIVRAVNGLDESE